MELITVLLAGILVMFFVYFGYSSKQLRNTIDLQIKDNADLTAELHQTIATLHDTTHELNSLEQHKQQLKEETEYLAKQLDGVQRSYQHKFDMWKLEEERRIRKDANRRSRSTMRGQATEHLAPFMLEDFNPSDFRFLGNPVDYLICKDASGIHDKTTDEVEEIILLDIKTGKADPSKVQRRIRDAIVAGRVSFAIYNTDTGELRTWPPKKNS